MYEMKQMSVSKLTLIIGAGILDGGGSSFSLFYLKFAFDSVCQQILLDVLHL